MADGQQLLASLLSQAARLSGAESAALCTLIPSDGTHPGETGQPDVRVVSVGHRTVLLVCREGDQGIVDGFVEPIRAALELESASMRAPRVLSSLGHELRTPLNAILGYTEMLLDDVYGDVPETVRDAIRRIHQSGRNMLSLTTDIVDLCAVEANRVDLAIERYSIDGLIQTIVASVQPEAAAKSVQLTTRFAPDLPVGVGDERRVAQALSNVVANAVTFSSASGEVVVDTAGADHIVDVRISDTGPSLSNSDLFSNTSARTRGEAGLKLLLAQRLVELHGGRMLIDSEGETGTTFKVSLPAQR
jgi:signal transduction histidine kinase